MDESDEIKRNHLEQLEKEITCAVCQEHYTESKILPYLAPLLLQEVHPQISPWNRLQAAFLLLPRVLGRDHPPRGRRTPTQNSFLCQSLQVQLLYSTESPWQGGGNV